MIAKFFYRTSLQIKVTKLYDLRDELHLHVSFSYYPLNEMGAVRVIHLDHQARL